MFTNQEISKNSTGVDDRKITRENTKKETRIGIGVGVASQSQS